MENFPHKDESYQIIGACMEVHNILGHGFLEVVYKDAIEYELGIKASVIIEKENIMSLIRTLFFLTNSLPTSLSSIK